MPFKSDEDRLKPSKPSHLEPTLSTKEKRIGRAMQAYLEKKKAQGNKKFRTSSQLIFSCTPGTCCSKLTTSFVNFSLKFDM